MIPSPDLHEVEIRREPGIVTTWPFTVRKQLPLKIYARPLLFFGFGAAVTIAQAPVLVGMIFVFMGIREAPLHWHVVVWLFVVLLIILLTIWCLGVGITRMIDALRSTPVLEVRPDGLVYHSEKLHLPWQAIRKAELRCTRYGHHLLLHLRTAQSMLQNPFRSIHALPGLWSRKTTRLHIPLLMLSESGHDTGHVILACVAAPGGEAKERKPDALLERILSFFDR